jgi:hypothetical protein
MQVCGLGILWTPRNNTIFNFASPIKNHFFVSPLPVTPSHEGKVGISGAGVVRGHHGLGAVAGLRSRDADEVGDHQALEPKRGEARGVGERLDG